MSRAQFNSAAGCSSYRFMDEYPDSGIHNFPWFLCCPLYPASLLAPLFMDRCLFLLLKCSWIKAQKGRNWKVAGLPRHFRLHCEDWQQYLFPDQKVGSLACTSLFLYPLPFSVSLWDRQIHFCYLDPSPLNPTTTGKGEQLWHKGLWGAQILELGETLVIYIKIFSKNSYESFLFLCCAFDNVKWCYWAHPWWITPAETVPDIDSRAPWGFSWLHVYSSSCPSCKCQSDMNVLVSS